MPAKSKSPQPKPGEAVKPSTPPGWREQMTAPITQRGLHDVKRTPSQPLDTESHAYNWRSRNNLKRGR